MSIIKLAFIGDIMTGDLFYTMGCGVRTSIQYYGNSFVDSAISNIFKNHDMVFCNLESIISDKGIKKNSIRSMDMRGTPDIASKLSEWGINVANVANNHILEHGHLAAKDTIELLNKSGIEVLGCGLNNRFDNQINILSKVISGIEFFFLSFCLIKDKYAYAGADNINEFLIQLRSIKDNHDGIIIVSLHWGSEYADKPSASQIELASKIFNAGADMIIGHHPHVYQGTICKENKLIAYSLGNFIFGDFFRDTDWSAILSITLKNATIESFELIPFFSDKNYRPTLATGKRHQLLKEEIQRRDIMVSNNDYNISDSSYEIETQVYTQQYRKEMRRFLFKNILSGKISPIYVPGILMRPVLRRLDLW